MNVQKTAAIICAAALGIGAYAQETSAAPVVEFYNELGSDVVNVTSDESEFAGVYNEMSVTLTSEKVDAAVTARAHIAADDNSDWGLVWSDDDFDWELVFRPIDGAAIGFSADYFFQGSYLAVEDDNTAGGKNGSDGVTFSYTGVDGLTLAATLPFSQGDANLFNSENEDGDTVYCPIGFGAEYTFMNDTAAIAAVVHDILNSDTRGFGVYLSYTGLEGLAVYGGYAYNDQEGICDTAGDHLINVSASFETEAFNAGLDYVTAGSDTFYAALLLGYNVTAAVNVSVTGTANAAYDTAGDGTYVAKPAVAYTNETLGEFVIEADISFADGEFDSLCFPLSWKYSF